MRVTFFLRPGLISTGAEVRSLQRLRKAQCHRYVHLQFPHHNDVHAGLNIRAKRQTAACSRDDGEISISANEGEQVSQEGNAS